MEPTSPKGDDIVRRGVYALHAHVPDSNGTGGEFYVRGRGERIDDTAIRFVVVEAASYAPHDRNVLFELRVVEARCNGYGDVALPEPPCGESPTRHPLEDDVEVLRQVRPLVFRRIPPALFGQTHGRNER